MVIPANINHPNLEPMAIGIASTCKVNANIGASPNSSDISEEIAKKLTLAVENMVADTLTDLSTGGGNLKFGLAIINASQFRSVPTHQTLKAYGNFDNFTEDDFLHIMKARTARRRLHDNPCRIVD
jgi:phosphomethylpyrimidine synthase